jgi:UDP-3-O-[3-hydroxymyristoyl] glucosamine N-acyltransferase
MTPDYRLSITAAELALLVQGELHAPPSLTITGGAGLAEAEPTDCSFLANPKYIDRLTESRAGIILVPLAVTVDRPVICVKNPHLAFARVLRLIEDKQRVVRPGIHPDARVAASALIGTGAEIGPFVVVEDGAVVGAGTRLIAQVYIGRNAQIGADCLVYPHVTVREAVRIGNRCIIHAGTEIGSDGFGFIPTAEGIVKIPQIGTVVIDDDVEIGGNCAIDRATTGMTRIGRGTKLDNLVHIAHNVRIGDACMLTGQVGIAGSAVIGNQVTFGGQSGAVGHITIGNQVTVAGKAGVTTPLKDGEVVSGFPARPHREELKLQALLHKLPELYARVRALTRK